MDVLTRKYPNCGDPLAFDPKGQKFHYEYCLNIYTEEEVSQYGQEQKEARMAGEESEEEPLPTEDSTFIVQEQLADMNEAEHEAVNEAGGFSDIADESTDNTTAIDLFLCPSCGAEIATGMATITTYYYHCHNPVVLSRHLSGGFLPNKMFLFAVEGEEAINRSLVWTKKKWFIPEAFFNKGQVGKLTGVYFPCWVTDIEVDGTMQANDTVVRIWRIGDTEYTETKQFTVSRADKLSFKKLVKNALSENTQQKVIEGVRPFLSDRATDFKNQYLTGFQAEKRGIEYEAIKSQVQPELKDYSERLLKDAANGYTTLTGVRTSASIINKVNNYVLLPIRFVTYRDNDSDKKIYYYIMSGQTGKTSGVLPISRKKLGLTALGIFAGLTILFPIGGYLIW